MRRMFQWPPLNVSTNGGRELGPQVNRFEQVSSDDHQMSVARGRGPMSGVGGGESVGPMSGVGGEGV